MEWLQYIYQELLTLGTGLLSVLSYVWSIFQSIWYGLTTILTGVYDVAVKIFTSGLF